jgi:hypothetical protein
MTLIVARKIGNEIRMYADAKLSYPGRLNNNPLKGALKLIVVNDVCIGYAGDYIAAVDSLRNIKKLKLTDFGEIIHILLETHKQSNCEVDFIVATYIPSIKLMKIANRRVDLDVDSTWIGNSEAFSEYQSIYHTLPPPPITEGYTEEESVHSEIISKMSDALATIVREGMFSSVGEFTISVRSSVSGFKYLGNSMAFIVPQTIPSGVETTLKFGTAQQGGYAYTVMTPNESRIGAIGVHFNQGSLGALYHPLESDEPIIYSNVTFEKFKASVSNDYGFKIDGVKIS